MDILWQRINTGTRHKCFGFALFIITINLHCQPRHTHTEIWNCFFMWGQFVLQYAFSVLYTRSRAHTHHSSNKIQFRFLLTMICVWVCFSLFSNASKFGKCVYVCFKFSICVIWRKKIGNKSWYGIELDNMERNSSIYSGGNKKKTHSLLSI